jgi:hypothetical protein
MQNTGINEIMFVILAIVRVFALIYCVVKAGRLNRNRYVWGVLGILFPIAALVIIQFIRPPQIDK